MHIHSKYARATSVKMDIDHLATFGKLKGLNLIGTGDFTHPKYLEEMEEKLQPIEATGFFRYEEMRFMLTTEVSTVYEQWGRVRKIHHVIHAPSFEVVEQINEELRRIGADLGIDGRLLLTGNSSPELVELLMSISKDIVVVPAHIWTPWFSCLGSRSGFDHVKDCYQDQTSHLFALETGLSSDPAMNWRLSELDGFALMSNSDSHSPWPWRLGRECNVFDLEKATYSELWEAVKERDPKRFLFTIEVDPSYGKYHFDGHRRCDVRLHPSEAMKLKNKCPRCRGNLTVGVLHRVEELADRPEGFTPKDAIPFKRLIPLSELIKTTFGIDTLYSKTVWSEFMKLIKRFNNEFDVLLNSPREELEKVTRKKLVDMIMSNREGRVKIVPGYDGVYGKPVLEENEEIPTQKIGQRNITNFV